MPPGAPHEADAQAGRRRAPCLQGATSSSRPRKTTTSARRVQELGWRSGDARVVAAAIGRLQQPEQLDVGERHRLPRLAGLVWRPARRPASRAAGRARSARDRPRSGRPLRRRAAARRPTCPATASRRRRAPRHRALDVDDEGAVGAPGRAARQRIDRDVDRLGGGDAVAFLAVACAQGKPTARSSPTRRSPTSRPRRSGPPAPSASPPRARSSAASQSPSPTHATSHGYQPPPR